MERLDLPFAYFSYLKHFLALTTVHFQFLTNEKIMNCREYLKFHAVFQAMVITQLWNAIGVFLHRGGVRYKAFL